MGRRRQAQLSPGAVIVGHGAGCRCVRGVWIDVGVALGGVCGELRGGSRNADPFLYRHWLVTRWVVSLRILHVRSVKSEAMKYAYLRPILTYLFEISREFFRSLLPISSIFVLSDNRVLLPMSREMSIY